MKSQAIQINTLNNANILGLIMVVILLVGLA
jgi:hypothetical protein